MATAYSNEVAVGTYNRIRLRVEYSETNASCHIEFRRTSTWTDTWSDSAASITFNGQTVSSPYSYSGVVDTNWREIASASGFSVPISGGTFSWSFNNPSSYAVLGCSGDITIGSQVVTPSVPTLSIVSVTKTSIEVSYGTASFGTPASGTIYLYGETATAPTAQIASKTTTGQSTFVWTGLTSGTTYYLRSNATNGSATSAYSTEVTATTTASRPALYGSVSGQTKEVKKLYGAVEATEVIGVTGEIESGATMITAFDADVFWSHHSAFNSLEISSVEVTYTGGGVGFSIWLLFSDGTASQRLDRGLTVAECAEYGITATAIETTESIYITLIKTPTGEYETKLVKKLYGSENGVTKLVYEA